MAEKENINEILEDIRKKLKPLGGPLTSIDPKKLEKVSEDVKVAKEIEKEIGNSNGKAQNETDTPDISKNR